MTFETVLYYAKTPINRHSKTDKIWAGILKKVCPWLTYIIRPAVLEYYEHSRDYPIPESMIFHYLFNVYEFDVVDIARIINYVQKEYNDGLSK